MRRIGGNEASNSVNGRRVPPQVPAYTDEMDDEIERINLSDLTLTESLHIQAAENHLEAFVTYINEGRILSTNNDNGFELFVDILPSFI